MDRHAEDLFLSLAIANDGVLDREQITPDFLSPQALRRRVAARRLHRVHPDVFSAVPPTLLSWRGAYRAAALAVGDDGALSHRAAAYFHALMPGIDPPPPEVVVRRTKAAVVGPAVRTHRTRRLSEDDVLVIDGIRVTSWQRTVIDCADVLPLRRLERVIETAQRLERPLPEQAVKGRRGAKHLRAALARVEPFTPRTKQELERRFLDYLDERALRRGVPNHRAAGYEIDHAWPDARLAVELDSRAFHAHGEQIDRDHRKTTALRLAGWEVIRATWWQITQPDPNLESLLRRFLHRPPGELAPQTAAERRFREPHTPAGQRPSATGSPNGRRATLQGATCPTRPDARPRKATG